ncbi:TonB-dependent receptor plug domain-containing protein [Opitutus sp. ER46]|uniref:TonB-dependent siderophore receptor n=1 Tax=Opitutus sp. ER46 TaxID=2161864 RepID=UPI000D31CF9D|nr:TonB-dependent receptor plug domain-containing protein [Opitutus sp. ER46]PTX97871.1 hypothetical protein DB354_06215 [Opitutus sp. ER46]
MTSKRPLLLLAALLAAELSAQTAPTSPTPTAAEEPVVLSPFLIRSERDRGYGATTSLGASRVALDMSNIPASVVSLNEQLFADIGAVDALEVLPYASGVQRVSNGAPGQEAFSLRGFAITGLRIRDGLPEVIEGVDQPYDESSVYERVEILKGPAGTLYGTTSMGGIVNKISKWPRFKTRHQIELQAQSYDEFYRAMVDSTGPLTENTAYRAVISERTGTRYYAKGDAPNDFTNLLLAFTHRFGRGRQGKVWTRLQYLRVELDTEAGPQYATGYLDPLQPTRVPVVSNPKFAVPVDANLYPEDDVSIANVRAAEAGYEQTWAGPLSGQWTLRVVGRYSKGRGDKSPSFAAARPVPIAANGAIVTYVNAAGKVVNGDSRYIGADDPRVADWRATMTVRDFAGFNSGGGAFVDLVGDFATGFLKHKLVLNAQLTKSARERAFYFWDVPNAANTSALANSFSMVNPDYAGFSVAQVKATMPMKFNAFNGHTESKGFAAGFQDNISLWDERLVGVVGARFDNVRATSSAFDATRSIAERRFVKDAASERTVSNHDWTFKYGLVGKPLPGVSVFAQLAETYIPINSADATGRKHPNQDGEIQEVGVKLDLLGNRLVATASVFKMELTNVLISVPNPPELGGGMVTVPAGTQNTDGWEMDLAYEPVKGLNLLLAYSDITSTNEAGNSFRGVAIDPTWSAFAKYRFDRGPLAGVFVGGGWKHYGRSAGDPTNTFYLDRANTFDAFVGYGRPRWSVQVNVYNVTNADDVISTVGDTAMFRPLERMYRMTFRYTF